MLLVQNRNLFTKNTKTRSFVPKLTLSLEKKKNSETVIKPGKTTEMTFGNFKFVFLSSKKQLTQ